MSKWVYTNIICQFFLMNFVYTADDDYNIVHKDGSFEFGYNNPDSYHFADGNRNNVVRGEFGGRNPKTGVIDSTVYTAGPRGFKPRGKNVFRKYDLSQSGPRPVGSPDDPYYDPYEDPSYNFAFKTRTYSRQENANRAGDVNGRFTYLDDIGERHNVEFIAGKNTGFHVKTPFPDSNPRAYGPLYFRGRGRPIPRGRTSIQRGLDGSYKFVSAGPDQRRTEVSDSTGHVRGSYTYLDDKGVQHSVHYIAGPETGYRVLKTVKGAHLPSVFPFDRPEIIPPDFYGYGPEGDVFDTAASGRPFKPAGKPSSRPPTSTDLGNGIDVDKDDYAKDSEFGGKKPASRPPAKGPSTSGGSSFDGGSSGDEDETSFDFGDLFGGSGGSTSKPSLRPGGRPSSFPTGRPTITTFKPIAKPAIPSNDGDNDDGSYKPGEDDDAGFYKQVVSSSTSKPGSSSTPSFSGYASGKPGGLEDDYDFNEVPEKGLFGGGSGDTGSYEAGVLEVGGGKGTCPKCTGTIVTNIGYKPFNVPPGVSVRAHVQSIDLYPFETRNPSEAFKAATSLKTEQLNESSSESTKDNAASENIVKSTTLENDTTTNKSD